MTPEDRRQLEQRAERALRRGEFPDALGLYRHLVQAFPADAALGARLAQLEGSLEPSELARARPPAPEEAAAAHPSPQHEAEALAGRGDFAGAMAVYQRLLAQDPGAELVRERLAELRQLVQATARVPAVSREQLFEHLLERISTRRRPG